MGGDNSGLGAIIAFFIAIIILAIITTGPEGERKPLFSFGDSQSTSTEERGTNTSVHGSQQPRYEQATPQRTLSNREVEERLARTYRELDDLEEDMRTLTIWGERSIYEDQVSLRRGNVRTEEVDREYLIIEASRRNERAIDITNWRVESYVTDRARWIEPGVRTYRRGRVNTGGPIWLEPGERAYIISGESPIGISFHENRCTGYLREHQDFYPPLSRSCPRIMDELEEYGRIPLDDDSCYEFVERVGRCEIPNGNVVEDADLSRACELFLIDELSYNECVDRYRYTPFFDEGEWYIYLKRDKDLWREEREIIRLLDRRRKTVDVIEY